MKRQRIKCHACHQDRPIWKFIGDHAYCKPCGKKVPPIAAILAVMPEVECHQCGDTTACFQAEFGDVECALLCPDCLTIRLSELIEEEPSEEEP